MQGNQVIRFSSCVLLLLLLSGPFAEASVSLGLKARGVVFKELSNQKRILIDLPISPYTIHLEP